MLAVLMMLATLLMLAFLLLLLLLFMLAYLSLLAFLLMLAPLLFFISQPLLAFHTLDGDNAGDNAGAISAIPDIDSPLAVIHSSLAAVGISGVCGQSWC